MSKLYFSEMDDCRCTELSVHKEYMQEHELKELELTEAKRVKCEGDFFCKFYQDIEKIGYCGRFCKEYKPNNGKNGRCRYYGYCYDYTEVKKIIKM